MIEYFFTCPYCWEQISVLLDSSVASQSYIEDCEVCCNPIQITAQFDYTHLIGFQADHLGQ